MSLPIYQRVAVTDAGDVIPGAEYTVINENTGVAAPIYSDRTGATLLTAPYFADAAGTIQFFIAQGTTFRVSASGGVGTYTDRYVYGVAEAVLVQADGDVNILSGNLLVGTTNILPAINNVEGIALATGSFGGRFEVSRNDDEPVAINRMVSDGSLISLKKNGVSSGELGTYSGLPYIGKGDVTLLFVDSSDHIIPRGVEAAQRTGVISLGDAGNTFKDLFLSGGVVFGDAGGTGTSSSNTFDDYEEGGFVGTLTPGSGSLAMDPNLIQMRYVKVGQLVTIFGNIIVSSVSAPAGDLILTGLPFSCVNETQNSERSGFLIYCSGLSQSTTSLIGLVIAFETQVRIGNFNGLTNLDTAGSLMQAGTSMTFNFSYLAE